MFQSSFSLYKVKKKKNKQKIKQKNTRKETKQNICGKATARTNCFHTLTETVLQENQFNWNKKEFWKWLNTTAIRYGQQEKYSCYTTLKKILHDHQQKWWLRLVHSISSKTEDGFWGGEEVFSLKELPYFSVINTIYQLCWSMHKL